MPGWRRRGRPGEAAARGGRSTCGRRAAETQWTLRGERALAVASRPGRGAAPWGEQRGPEPAAGRGSVRRFSSASAAEVSRLHWGFRRGGCAHGPESTLSHEVVSHRWSPRACPPPAPSHGAWRSSPVRTPPIFVSRIYKKSD